MQTHVRIRMCQFIEKFLGAMNMNAVLDANICEGIERYMILNADDFSNIVRSVALNGLQRLQDPTNPTAATWKHYLFHLNDPAVNVRKAVISSICKNRFSIPKLLEHLMDKEQSVRCHLVQTLANVSYKHYKIEDRIKLVEDGLQPSQPSSVIKGVQDTILTSWFAEMERNYLKFTKNLVLESSWKEFQRSVLAAKRALKHLFSQDPGYLQYLDNQMTKTDNELMDSICDSVERSLVMNESQQQQGNTSSSQVGPAKTYEQCIDMNRLTPEIAIYWSTVLEYYQEHNEDDAIFPELNVYLHYLEAFGRRSASTTSDIKQKRRFQFVFGLLVDNLHMYDFKDECCRQFLKETSSRLILSTNIKKDTLRTLLRIHSDVYPEEGAYLDSIVQAIHEELSKMGDLSTTSVRGADQELRIKHYLKVVYLLLVNRKIRKLTPLLTDLFHTVIFPRIENGHRKIRIWSTKCAATYAALDASVAQSFYHKLIAQLQVQHNVPVWAVIIESIFDLLARYGIEFLSTPGGGANAKRKSTTDSPPGDGQNGSSSCMTRTGRALYNTTSECWNGNLDESMDQVNILEILQTLYDDCSDLMIVRPIVLGFCRLILTEQCQSVELMMKLLVTFFTTDTYPELVQILGAFFVELCENGLQDLLVLSLLPTLEYVGANPNLPVDMDSVVQFVVDSTSPKSSDSGQYHLKLAHLFVETIQTNDKHKALVRIMFKYLNQLVIPSDAIDQKELERMCNSLAKCDHLKPDQLDTVRRKLSGVRKEGSVAGSGTITGVAASLLESVAETTAESEATVMREVVSTITEVAEEEQETVVNAEPTSLQDVEMATAAEESDTEKETVAESSGEDNTTIPATPESTILALNSTVSKTVTEEIKEASTVDEETTLVTATKASDDDQLTDCSVSSFKENATANRSTGLRRGRPAKGTAIPRRVADAPLNESKESVERKLRQGKTASRIPVIASERRNKRALDRSTTMMTPDVKQKRTETDPNVRKRSLSARQVQSAERAPRTPTGNQGVSKTKQTSTPINDSMLMQSRVVLSPLDMSEINKTRPKTRSVTVYSQRALRTRNTNK